MLADTKSAQYSKVLGNWNIYKRIGHGTNGKTVVYQIVRRNSTWEESCALKAVPLICENGVYSQFTEERRREYLKSLALRKEKAVREVQYMSALRGKTNIVDYIDYDTVEWKESDSFGCDLLIRMELLHNLRDELRNGRIFSEKEIIKIGRDICSALIVCHEKNILHRDIKPENIFFNDDGDYKLGDFGIARILDQCQDSASTGIGTPEYAAPEQSSGKYDMRVDIYSLGLVLYELSNRNCLPFAQSAYLTENELRSRLLGKPLPKPRNVSPSLSNIILKACAFDPSERYQSARDMLDALRKISQPSNIKSASTLKEPSLKKKELKMAQTYETIPAKPDSVCNASEGSRKTVEQRAIDGDAKAQYLLSVMYFKGEGVPQNDKSAVEWLQKASAQEYPAALFQLGNCYENGIGVKKDKSKAFLWYSRAASRNVPEAFVSLAHCYKQGIGTEMSIEKAISYYEKAAQLGMGDAFKELGDYYYEGKGEEKNIVKALDYYLQAIKAENIEAAKKYDDILKRTSRKKRCELEKQGHTIDNIGKEMQGKVRRSNTSDFVMAIGLIYGPIFGIMGGFFLYEFNVIPLVVCLLLLAIMGTFLAVVVLKAIKMGADLDTHTLMILRKSERLVILLIGGIGLPLVGTILFAFSKGVDMVIKMLF